MTIACGSPPAGRALYEQEWGRYHELYPHIEAPAPALTREVAR
jgi:hypothetical protein